MLICTLCIIGTVQTANSPDGILGTMLSMIKVCAPELILVLRRQPEALKPGQVHNCSAQAPLDGDGRALTAALLGALHVLVNLSNRSAPAMEFFSSVIVCNACAVSCPKTHLIRVSVQRAEFSPAIPG